MSEPLHVALREKQELRLSVAARRQAQLNPDLLSDSIWQRMLALPEFTRADTIMMYLDFGAEVRTRQYVPELWKIGKKVAVPYCTEHELHLFLLQSMDELAPCMWEILEPKPHWRASPDRRLKPADLDLIVVPGLAFDRFGDRLGLGKGYYDRFLLHVRADAVKIALAFECQLVEKIPTMPHDVRMDMIITEKTIYSQVYK